MARRLSAVGVLGLALGLVGALACSTSSGGQQVGTAGSSGNGASGTTGGTGAMTAGAGGVAVAGSGAGSTPSVAGSGGGGGGGANTGDAGSAAGGVAGAGGVMGSAGSAGGSSVLTGNVSLMVLGSSNEVITCWRAFLWQELQAANIKSVDFVGEVNSGPDCGVPGYDKDLQAQSGQIVSTLPASKFQEWFTAHPPDIILQHFGGADLLANMPVDGVMQAYSLALAQARLVKPQVRLFIAQHTPQNSNGCNACDQSLLELNADIVTWAAQNTTADSPITVVDLYTGIVPATDLSDGVHLNPTGSQKVADRWFAALKPLFKP